MFFDTHAHYDDAAFDADRDGVLEALPAAGVELVVNPGCGEESSLMAMALAERWPYVYAAVGWHPQEADSFDGDSLGKLEGWAGAKKVVAIGEIGLDYHYEGPSREKQREVFAAQLDLAARLDLPVIVHDREAHADCLELVRDRKGLRGVFHCYSGSAEMAEELIKLGWYLSFTGAVTFKNARRALEAIEVCPPERIMIETDSPYLAPVPFRGRRNDSRLLPYIARVIAQVKGVTEAEAAALTAANGRRFFGIE